MSQAELDKANKEIERLKKLLKEVRCHLAVADDRGTIIAKIDCFTETNKP